MNAKPAELLETAIRNLKTGAKQLVLTRNEEEEPSSGTVTQSFKATLLVVTDVIFTFLASFFFLDLKTGLPLIVPAGGGNQEVLMPARILVNRSVDQPKTANWEHLSEWKIPTFVGRHISPEVRYSF